MNHRKTSSFVSYIKIAKPWQTLNKPKQPTCLMLVFRNTYVGTLTMINVMKHKTWLAGYTNIIYMELRSHNTNHEHELVSSTAHSHALHMSSTALPISRIFTSEICKHALSNACTSRRSTCTYTWKLISQSIHTYLQLLINTDSCRSQYGVSLKCIPWQHCIQ